MGSRRDLDTLLRSILGSTNTYFQPPESVKMDYPCIVYKLSDIDTTFANNQPYSFGTKYSVTVIEKSADMTIVDKVKALPMCTFDRPYVANNLNHYSFNLYF